MNSRRRFLLAALLAAAPVGCFTLKPEPSLPDAGAVKPAAGTPAPGSAAATAVTADMITKTNAADVAQKLSDELRRDGDAKAP